MIQSQISGVQLSTLHTAASTIIKLAGVHKLWCFEGEMGAGKTTIIKAIGKQLGVEDEQTSPSFSLVNEYKTKDGNTIYHFDFYRINTLEEVYDIGYEDYFYSGNICLIEWPSKINQILETEIKLEIHIQKETTELRTISINS